MTANVLEEQRRTWDGVCAGWQRWQPQFERGGATVSQRLVALGGLRPGRRVLDLGTGLGQPALTAAAAVGADGWVLGADVSAAMLAAAQPAADGVGNLDLVQADALQLADRPELVGSFDAALSRWCLMLTPDPAQTLAALRRLLRPGGVLAASVWGPPADVPVLSLPFQVLRQRVELPPPEPGAPGPYALSDPVRLTALLSEAGFRDVTVEDVWAPFGFDSTADFTRFALDVLPPRLRELIRQRYGTETDPPTWQAVAELAAARSGVDGRLRLPSRTLCLRAVAAPRARRTATRLVHSGQLPAPETGDLVPPLHLSTTYDRRHQGSERYFYSRSENPTRENLEVALAEVEGAQFALAYASGQAAAAAAAALVPPGRRIVCSDDVYGGTRDLLDRLPAGGVTVQYADLTDPDDTSRALAGTDLAMVWVETPSNPMLKVVDLAALRTRLAEREVLLLVDNTFATAVLQRPLELGADLSLYSTTKFVAGHADVIGGALVLDRPALDARLRGHRTATGGVPGPLDCYLVHRGLKTLAVRLRQQVATAAAVAELLGRLPTVAAVHYPGLPDHPQHELAARQMAAPGSMVSFEYRGPTERVLQRVELLAVAVSLGGVSSLVQAPALSTHRALGPGLRGRLGITDSLLRVSVGIEDEQDVLDDLAAALRD